ncbi:MAG: diphthine synthase [Candidatus Micrarchaeota archaeon]|nr:diphthine synthase [Candidatus Micrarchaeota archaeon]
MLYLVGVGLSYKDVSPRAMDALLLCDGIHIDYHTSVVDGKTLELVESETGIKPTALERRQFEDDAAKLVRQASASNVAVLFGGDPLVATTHKILFIEAKRQSVKVETIHSVSAISVAIGESGLDFYRFGPVCTIASWSEHYKPTSFYETIASNATQGSHSLVLLDFDRRGHSMDLGSAIRILEEAERQHGKGIINEETQMIIMHSITQDGERKILTTLGAAKKLALPEGPTLLILPGRTTDIERECMAAMLGGV